MTALYQRVMIHCQKTLRSQEYRVANLKQTLNGISQLIGRILVVGIDQDCVESMHPLLPLLLNISPQQSLKSAQNKWLLLPTWRDMHQLLTGDYNLGTRENPTIWYVGGNLRTSGAATLSGYGVFIVKNNIDLKHNVTTTTDPGEITVGFYTGKNLNLTQASIAAQLFVGNDITFKETVTIWGNIAAGNNARLKGSTTIYYRPTSPALTELFWPMSGN